MTNSIHERATVSVATRETEGPQTGSVPVTQPVCPERGNLWRRASARLSALLEPGKKNAIPPLDGVRACACLLVVGYHISLITRDTHVWNPTDYPPLAAVLLSGESGVTLFFVLSGFLLFLPYARALLFKMKWPSARQFYLRRALRIIPAYYICLFALILLAHREYLQADHWPQLFLFLTFFMDSTSRTYQAIDGPFWTLAVEWQFYLLLPLLVLGMRVLVWRCAPGKRLWCTLACLLVVIAWGMISHFWLAYVQQHPWPATLGWRLVYGLLFGQGGKYLQDFAVGMLVSLLYVSMRHSDARGRLKAFCQRYQFWFWILALVLYLATALWHENAVHGNGLPWLSGVSGYYSLLGEVGYASAFALCLLALLFGQSVLPKLFSLAPLRWIGHVSYSAYMWHFPLLIFFMVSVGYSITSWNIWAVAVSYWLWVLLAILPFSLVTFLLTERPGMWLSGKLRRGS